MNKVIVVGGDHHNTLGVVRSLGEKGIRPDVFIISKDGQSFVARSKYIHALHILRNDQNIVSDLFKYYGQEKEKPVVICCYDRAASIMDLHAEKLKDFFIIPGNDKQGRITCLMNKQKMSELAEKCGLHVPRTIYPTFLPLDDNKVDLPCIVKPLVSKDGSKNDIRICHQLEEVNEQLENIGVENVQIQRYIDKEFEYQLIGCSTGEDVIIPGVSRILRPCKGSNTSFLHYEPLEGNFCDIDSCKFFVRQTGYKGLFSLEFLRDKDGTDFFMEINFRNDGNAICVTAAGVNLPYIWYLSCIGKDYSAEVNKQIIPKYIMPDSAEIRLLVTRQISVFQYLSDLIKTDRFMEFDRKDMKPFWRMLKFKYKNVWSKNI